MYIPSAYTYDRNWGSDTGNLGADELLAQNVGSSIFYISILVGQMGHLLSVRRKSPYFSDAILATDSDTAQMNVLRRLWIELTTSQIRWPIVYAWIAAICTSFVVNNIPFFNVYCGTAPVPGKNWGIAIGT